MTENSPQKAKEKNDLWNYVEKFKPQIEDALRLHLPLAPPAIETKFNEAVEYAIFSGGKRLRPVLTLLGAELIGGNTETLLPCAAAVEFVHTSSLIFDDLPCMDNAVERRGKTSLHEKFGEGLAILAALGLLNSSYGLIFVNQQDFPNRAVEALAEMVVCVGASGMVGGQSFDLALAQTVGAVDFSVKNHNLESVRNLKTSSLMRLALKIGAILAGASHSELTRLSRIAELLGDAYQLSDDLIDLEEDDAIFNRNKTFAGNKGRNAAQLKLNDLVEEAKMVLIDNFPANEARGCLIQLADYLSRRRS